MYNCSYTGRSCGPTSTRSRPSESIINLPRNWVDWNSAIPHTNNKKSIIALLKECIYKLHIDDIKRLLCPESHRKISYERKEYIEVAFFLQQCNQDRVQEFSKNVVYYYRNINDVRDRLLHFLEQQLFQENTPRGYHDTRSVNSYHSDSSFSTISSHSSFRYDPGMPNEIIAEPSFRKSPSKSTSPLFHQLSQNNKPVTRSSLFSRQSSSLKETSTLTITLVQSWGDSDQVGLKGLELVKIQYGKRLQSEIPPDQITIISSSGERSHPMNCKSMNVLFPANSSIEIQIPTIQSFSELLLYNYDINDKRHLGVKFLRLVINGKPLTEELIYVRKAPDAQGIEPQRISLTDPQTIVSKLPSAPPAEPYVVSFNHYLRPTYPRGSIFKFQLHATCQNKNAIGVENIFFLNPEGKMIPKEEVYVLMNKKECVASCPPTFSQFYYSHSPTHPPLCIYMGFQSPVVVACIKITDPQGYTQSVSIFVDDMLIYTGDLNHVQSNEIWFTAKIPVDRISMKPLPLEMINSGRKYKYHDLRIVPR